MANESIVSPNPRGLHCHPTSNGSPPRGEMEICYREEQDTRRTGRYCSGCMYNVRSVVGVVEYRFMTKVIQKVRGHPGTSSMETI